MSNTVNNEVVRMKLNLRKKGCSSALRLLSLIEKSPKFNEWVRSKSVFTLKDMCRVYEESEQYTKFTFECDVDLIDSVSL